MTLLTRADYEVELAVVLRSCKDVSEQDALNHVLGYCIANDVSSRKLCAAGAQWGLGKVRWGLPVARSCRCQEHRRDT